MSLIGTATLDNGIEIMGVLVGPFIVFKGGEGWNITVRALGVAVKQDCCCGLRAILIAEAIEPLIDWTRDRESIREDPRRGNVMVTALLTRCPIGCERHEQSMLTVATKGKPA